MISKELLSAVYPIDETTETYVGIQESTGRVMWFGKEHNDCRSEIDIHRVAHKCKEWAVIRQFYNVASLLDYTGYTCIIRQDPMTFINTELRFRAGTEPEAIFRACQWILNKDSK